LPTCSSGQRRTSCRHAARRLPGRAARRSRGVHARSAAAERQRADVVAMEPSTSLTARSLEDHASSKCAGIGSDEDTVDRVGRGSARRCARDVGGSASAGNTMQREATAASLGLNLWRTNLRRRVVATLMTASPAERRASAAARRASRRRAALARVTVPSMPAPSCRTSSAAAECSPHSTRPASHVCSQPPDRVEQHASNGAPGTSRGCTSRKAAAAGRRVQRGSPARRLVNARSRHPPCRLDAHVAGGGADEQRRRTRVRCAVLGMSSRMRAGCQPCWRPALCFGPRHARAPAEVGGQRGRPRIERAARGR